MREKILCYSSVLLEIPEREQYLDQLRDLGYDVVAPPFKTGYPEEILKEYLPGASAFLSGGYALSKAQLAAAGNLRVVSHLASGYDQVDVEMLTRAGVALTNTPIQAMAEPVADLAVGLMFALARQIPQYDRNAKQGNYGRGWGMMVSGRTLGIIGLGAIGKELAKRVKGLSMEIIVYNRNRDMDLAREYGFEYVEWDELFARADYVSVHLRLNSETKGIIGQREFMRMKPTAYFINTARLQIVDEEALYESLIQGRIAGAALDGDTSGSRDLVALDCVIATPHMGNRVASSSHAVITLGIQNAIDVLEGRTPKFLINPQVKVKMIAQEGDVR